MAVKKHPLGLPARFTQASTLLDEPPLGHLMALVLDKLERLGSDAYGYKVLEQLSLDGQVWIDHVQIYSTIRKLLDRKLIAAAGKRAKPGGPSVKLYKVTTPGREALEVTAAHYKAVSDQLNVKRKGSAA